MNHSFSLAIATALFAMFRLSLTITDLNHDEENFLYDASHDI